MRGPLLTEIRTAGGVVADASAEQDIRHHIELLMTSIELEEPSVFGDHARLCRARLEADRRDVAELVDTFTTLREGFLGLLSPSAAEAVHGAVAAGVEALSESPHGLRASDGMSPLCHLYVATAITGRREEALAIAREAIDAAESRVDVYVDLFEAALHEVGRRWQHAGLTIAEEHIATATTQYVLAVLHAELVLPVTSRGRAVVTGVPGEHHTVATSIVADILEEQGWDVRTVGSDAPVQSVVEVINRYGADLLAISVTMGESVPRAAELIDAVRTGVSIAPHTIVGGAPFQQDPELWRAVGADGFASNAREMAELLGTP